MRIWINSQTIVVRFFYVIFHRAFTISQFREFSMSKLIRIVVPISLSETMQCDKNSYGIAKGKLVDKVERLSFGTAFR